LIPISFAHSKVITGNEKQILLVIKILESEISGVSEEIETARSFDPKNNSKRLKLH